MVIRFDDMYVKAGHPLKGKRAYIFLKAFVLNGKETQGVGAALNEEGIAVRSGHHCAQPILRRFGLESTVRPSFALYNTFADIDALTAALHKIQSGHNPYMG